MAGFSPCKGGRRLSVPARVLGRLVLSVLLWQTSGEAWEEKGSCQPWSFKAWGLICDIGSLGSPSWGLFPTGQEHPTATPGMSPVSVLELASTGVVGERRGLL